MRSKQKVKNLLLLELGFEEVLLILVKSVKLQRSPWRPNKAAWEEETENEFKFFEKCNLFMVVL